MPSKIPPENRAGAYLGSMATSQNGYPVLFENRTTGSLPRLRKFEIPGVNRHLFLRDGSAGFVLLHFALWFDESLERLDIGVWDDWGWAVRAVRGQTSGYSNHASGTAMDLNATKHPLGVATHQTFTNGQIAKIHNRLDLYDECLRWGGDYQNRPDAMHVEIDKPIGAVQKVADRLVDSPRGKRILKSNPGLLKVINS